MTGNPKDSKWYVTQAADRTRKPITLTVSDGARAALKRLAAAHDESMSAVVERLVLAAAKKKRSK